MAKQPSIISRPDKESHEQTIWYEIELLRHCKERLTNTQWQNSCDKYIYIESFLLHFRNLIVCFSGNHHRKNTDIDFSNLGNWTNIQLDPRTQNAIRKPAKKLHKTYYNDISKFLSHITKVRFEESGKGWPFVEMSNDLEKVVVLFKTPFPQKQHFCHLLTLAAITEDSTHTATIIPRT